MDKESTPYRVHSCSKCHGDKEYYCEFCLCDLCPQCKVSHLKYFETRNHYVVPTIKKSTTSQHKSSVRDILDMFIEGIVNLVKSLCVIRVLWTIHTHLEVFTLDKDST